MWAVKGWLGVNACRDHIIVSAVTAKVVFSIVAWRWLGADGDITAAILILQSPFCVGVEDGWGYRSSILRDCDTDIVAVIPIMQSPIWCRVWQFVQEYV